MKVRIQVNGGEWRDLGEIPVYNTAPETVIDRGQVVRKVPLTKKQMEEVMRTNKEKPSKQKPKRRK